MADHERAVELSSCRVAMSMSMSIADGYFDVNVDVKGRRGGKRESIGDRWRERKTSQYYVV